MSPALSLPFPLPASAPIQSLPPTLSEDHSDHFRGIVYIDGLGDIVDVQAPLLKFQVIILFEVSLVLDFLLLFQICL